MHDTAYKIGCLAIDIYCDPTSAILLEVGSYDVNGSLRNHVGSRADYVGIDFEEGPGVDIVVAPGELLPVDDDHFDLVIASSALEHDPAFWNTFLEMCRKAKRGGHIYINVPSNGAVHRYPYDCWRFYPDAGRALAAWARSQGEEIELVESFVANREDDIWNDFVSVFRKVGGIDKNVSNYLYHNCTSYNVLVGDAGEIINPIAQTEDMLLGSEANARISRLEGERGAVKAEAVRLERALAASEEGREAILAKLKKAEEALRDQGIERDAIARQLGEHKEKLIGYIYLSDKYKWMRDIYIAGIGISAWWSIVPYYFRKKKEMRIISDMGLFDGDRYCRLNKDVEVDGVDPLSHYIIHGIAEERII